MPYKCCVPLCKGNYKSGPKVCLFSFPKEKKLARAWLHAIKRTDFTPTKYTKVCELHFRSEDIECETSFFDERTLTKVQAKLKHPRLRQGVVPSQLPNCPAYLSLSPVSDRESPDERRSRMEEIAIEEALKQSVVDHEELKECRKFRDLDELVKN
ncbi:THAP domain-containing protein 1 B-like [Portunus trituberculatus]|uniref:THAP domain-containing protein 1 B-like n=1 Tax=Portunus trituberculatus TaxID=210409 RepID=UPI001E1CCCBF|nr:THAP domain-containing protein 1 B-like [Portunus trituberculatus]